jgi:hypothetical protein
MRAPEEIPPMTEYKVVDANDAASLQERLNLAVKEGFEFLAVFSFGGGHIGAVLVKRDDAVAATGSTAVKTG